MLHLTALAWMASCVLAIVASFYNPHSRHSDDRCGGVTTWIRIMTLCMMLMVSIPALIIVCKQCSCFGRLVEHLGECARNFIMQLAFFTWLLVSLNFLFLIADGWGRAYAISIGQPSDQFWPQYNESVHGWVYDAPVEGKCVNGSIAWALLITTTLVPTGSIVVHCATSVPRLWQWCACARPGAGADAAGRSSPREVHAERECPVCLVEIGEDGEDVSQWTRLPRCGHVGHTACMVRAMRENPQCPLCREHVDLVREAEGPEAQNSVAPHGIINFQADVDHGAPCWWVRLWALRISKLALLPTGAAMVAVFFMFPEPEGGGQCDRPIRQWLLVTGVFFVLGTTLRLLHNFGRFPRNPFLYDLCSFFLVCGDWLYILVGWFGVEWTFDPLGRSMPHTFGLIEEVRTEDPKHCGTFYEISAVACAVWMAVAIVHFFLASRG